jgi:demethylmenaquinone methyltransferase/2-methoxy-6-polyprenyl-1,4-benzoquinol methylase
MTARRGKPLHRIFTAVPRRYDLINRAITLGLDARWRRRAARECLKGNPRRVLDLCCGTGDLALDVARLGDGGVAVSGVDFSLPMLEIAGVKAAGEGVSFVYGDVGALPFAEGSFDCVGISFAFRNLTYKNPLAAVYLPEVRRVLAEGGRFVIVETSQPASGLVRRLYHLYLRLFAYPVGRLLSGNREAYRYLAESAARFFTPGEVGELLKGAGFRGYSYRPLLFGATAIYIAVK